MGYSENEATQYVYPNIPEVLRDTGIINSRLYSVYLNDVAEISGNILFGGIDTTKFKGELVAFDLLPTDIQGQNTDTVDQFITTVTALSVTINGAEQNIFTGGTNSIAAYTSQDTALAVVLDTGSSAWSMPQSYYNAVTKIFTYVDQYGLCACSHANNDTVLTLTMGGALNISVPAREFIVPIYYANNNTAVPYTSTDNACAFMISNSSLTGEGVQPMGDAMLRSMYLVYDLDNAQVAIAQSNVNSTASPNIVTVAAGPSGIASAVSSGFSSAPSNTWSIAPLVQNATGSFSVSTAQSTIGEATGTAAVPFDARVSATGATGQWEWEWECEWEWDGEWGCEFVGRGCGFGAERAGVGAVGGGVGRCGVGSWDGGCRGRGGVVSVESQVKGGYVSGRRCMERCFRQEKGHLRGKPDGVGGLGRWAAGDGYLPLGNLFGLHTEVSNRGLRETNTPRRSIPRRTGRARRWKNARSFTLCKCTCNARVSAVSTAWAL